MLDHLIVVTALLVATTIDIIAVNTFPQNNYRTSHTFFIYAFSQIFQISTEFNGRIIGELFYISTVLGVVFFFCFYGTRLETKVKIVNYENLNEIIKKTLMRCKFETIM